MAKRNMYPTPCLDCGGETRPAGHGILTKMSGKWYCRHPRPVGPACDCGRPNCGGCDDTYDAMRDAAAGDMRRRR